jgi:hypothetical protein
MRQAERTLSNLHRSLCAQGFHEWYLDWDWYGSPKSGPEPQLTLILFRSASSDRLSGTTYTLHCHASRLDITSSVPENTYKPVFQDDVLTIMPIGSRSPCFQRKGFLPLSRESIKAFFNNAYHPGSPEILPSTMLCKAWQDLVALLTAGTTADSPESTNTSKQATSAELEPFLKELAAELHITPEVMAQIWKDYHPEQKASHDELQAPGSLSRPERSVSV